MNECSFITETPSAKIEICLKYTMTSSDSLLPYENKSEIDKLCEQRCSNYNNKWSCPPNSPKYSLISKNFNYAYIFIFYCYLEQFNYIKMPYMRKRVANSILRSKSNKIMRQLEIEVGGKMLSNGSCRLCKACSCKTKEGKCKKVSLLRYSMESVGLNIENISIDLLNHELSRYNNNMEYSSAITAILTKRTVNKDEISSLILTC